jgi:hypothetical protein
LSDPVSAALQRYADRGVFRGFRAEAARGRVAFRFSWITPRPMAAVFDARRGVLAFPALLPAAGDTPGVGEALAGLVAGRRGRLVPAHKRVDARRARLACAVRKGDGALTVQVRGANHDYAVRHALGLINDLFVTLRETHPEYLAERFGISNE